MVDNGAVKAHYKASGSQVIELKVGEHCFSTTRATLCKYGDSMLAKMFSGDLPPSCLD